jgi:hypothetical protein
MAVPPGIDDPACRRLRGALDRSVGENTAIAGNVTGDKGREMLGIWRVRRGWYPESEVRSRVFMIADTERRCSAWTLSN